MSLVVLIRHAHSQANALGVLSGRRPNIDLSEKGIKQALELRDRLGTFPIKEVRVSPLQRCSQTIAPWLDVHKKVRVLEDVDITEVDYGKWSGKKLAVLSKESLWKIVQSNPSRAYFPQGEGLMAMQARALHSQHAALSAKGQGAVVLVSHGDVIKSLVAANLGMHLDDFQRIIIDPASITIFDFSSSQPRLLLLNETRSSVHELLTPSRKTRYLVGGGSGVDLKKKK